MQRYAGDRVERRRRDAAEGAGMKVGGKQKAQDHHTDIHTQHQRSDRECAASSELVTSWRTSIIQCEMVAVRISQLPYPPGRHRGSQLTHSNDGS